MQFDIQFATGAHNSSTSECVIEYQSIANKIFENYDTKEWSSILESMMAKPSQPVRLIVMCA